MLVLGLDSSGSGCSACVWRDGKTLAIGEEQMERGQDQRLMPLILTVMTQANITFEELDRIAVTRGPGSFTGLRIGLAAARGIGLAANKPVVGIDRFSIYREQFKASNLLVVINSKRKELFCKFYLANIVSTDALMIPPEEIIAFTKDRPGILVTGDSEVPGLTFQKATEKEVITCAALAAQADLNNPDFLPRPLYLRAPDVTIKPQATSQAVDG